MFWSHIACAPKRAAFGHAGAKSKVKVDFKPKAIPEKKTQRIWNVSPQRCVDCHLFFRTYSGLSCFSASSIHAASHVKHLRPSPSHCSIRVGRSSTCPRRAGSCQVMPVPYLQQESAQSRTVSGVLPGRDPEQRSIMIPSSGRHRAWIVSC